jgi:hypothetical protein
MVRKRMPALQGVLVGRRCRSPPRWRLLLGLDRCGTLSLAVVTCLPGVRRNYVARLQDCRFEMLPGIIMREGPVRRRQ